MVGVFVRPYALEFLERMANKYTVGLFTASTKNYALKMMKILDPMKKGIFKFGLFRPDCNIVNDLHIKDLRALSDVSAKDVIIIDNLIYSFAFDLENGIPIRPYIKEEEDYELEFIADALEKIDPRSDVRESLEQTFGLKQFYSKLV